MVQCSAAVLDRNFSALADAHRRQILDRLGSGPVSISELATQLDISLPGVLKHVHALEDAQMLTTRKQGRTRWCELSEQPLDVVADWVADRRRLWTERLDRFERSVGPTE
jgi:DNA-binding transcriptional ArsR family regulator